MIEYETKYQRWLAEELQSIKSIVVHLLAKSERIESVMRRTLEAAEKQNAKAEEVQSIKNLVEDLLAKSERIESVTRRTLKDVEKANAKAEGDT